MSISRCQDDGVTDAFSAGPQSEVRAQKCPSWLNGSMNNLRRSSLQGMMVAFGVSGFYMAKSSSFASSKDAEGLVSGLRLPQFPLAATAACASITEAKVDRWANVVLTPYRSRDVRAKEAAEAEAASEARKAAGQGHAQVDEDDEDEDEEIDMSPAETCGFCAYFLNSPCKRPFHRWKKCVDAKKEGVST